MDNFNIRLATEKDLDIILKFIKDLADYEKMLEEVVATKDLLKKWLFEKEKAYVLIAEYDNKAVGFALYFYNFYNFSTFFGRCGIYLEDLYIEPAYRKKGFGKLLIKKLCEIAVEEGCGRVEWWCLDWNKSSIDFYLSIGAEPMDDWTVYRISGKNLIDLGTDKK